MYNTELFIKRAKEIHGDKYNYSKVEYKKSVEPVCIICPEHGEFWQTPHHHLRGSGCIKCSIKNQTYTTDKFIELARKVHGDKYDYSKVEYKDSHTKICIICPEHGEFYQMPYDHLNGKGCKLCGLKTSSAKMKTTKQFIEDARKVHGDKYDYSKVEYKGCFNKVCIVCPEHGEFWQTPNCHLNGQGCPVCRESKMEKLVESILNKNYINFERQKKFDWLGQQSLDFYLPEYNVGIECQGIQHYKPVSFGSKKYDKYKMLELVKNRDDKKKKLCETHNIRILYFSTEVCAKNVLKNENSLVNELKKYDI